MGLRKNGITVIFMIVFLANASSLDSSGFIGPPSDSPASPTNLPGSTLGSSNILDSSTSSDSANSSSDRAGSLFVSEDSGQSLTAGSHLSLDGLKELKTSLLDGYDLNLRPRLNQSHSVQVNTSFVLNSVVEFDTTGQRVGVMGYFIIGWKDEVLKWISENYNGTSYIKLPLNSIWYPPLVISKTYDESKVIGNAGIDRVSVSADGLVHWVPDGIFNFMCEVSVKHYPFDVQTCELIFYVSDETVSSVQLNGEKNVQLQYYVENSEWRLVDAYSTTKEMHNTNFVHLTFSVERRADFTVYTMIIPLVALSLLNVFTFLVPIESGEKSGLAITLFLAYGFFVTITRDGLPHNSVQVSYYIVYITILLVLSGLTVICVIIESKIFFSLGTSPFHLCRLFKSNKVDDGETVSVTTEKESEIFPEKECLRENMMTWTDILGRLDVILFATSAAFVTLVSIVLWSLVITRN